MSFALLLSPDKSRDFANQAGLSCHEQLRPDWYHLAIWITIMHRWTGVILENFKMTVILEEKIYNKNYPRKQENSENLTIDQTSTRF